MATREIHLELLLGKPVKDATGKSIGRIEEIRVQQQGNEWVIKEYLIGTIAILERLSAWTVGLGLLHLLGATKIYNGYRVPWEKLDLSDPNHPRLRCTIEELKEIHAQIEKAQQPKPTA
ncbi:hypothetical protein [Gloeothece verrucosa]|uniref:PRC-barrel domain-containing protein n=1 Tax=Gloeothece verrucosa (strain PCC 7822) TaxID=497965 RepID=E0U8E5_GLOV7|nr:hypothetical protein [Gloeothece verrucosa]ADN12581.1 conserved hypothetical protein [Gloeothece verrucosa PCC 7822]